MLDLFLSKVNEAVRGGAGQRRGRGEHTDAFLVVEL